MRRTRNTAQVQNTRNTYTLLSSLFSLHTADCGAGLLEHKISKTCSTLLPKISKQNNAENVFIIICTTIWYIMIYKLTSWIFKFNLNKKYIYCSLSVYECVHCTIFIRINNSLILTIKMYLPVSNYTLLSLLYHGIDTTVIIWHHKTKVDLNEINKNK